MEKTPLSTFFDHLDSVMASLDQLNELVENHFNYDPDNMTWEQVNDVGRLDEALTEILEIFTPPQQ